MLTIIIPTMNRSEYLIRLLNYYAATGYQHWISIGDSSSPLHIERTRKTIDNLKGKLKINYSECPGMNDSDCFAKLAEEVKTPYAVYIADDDLLLPDAMDKCIDFLEKNQDYSAAHGRGVMFVLDRTGAHGEMVRVHDYPQPVAERATAAERLMCHMENYRVSLFSVHRTAVWKEMFKKNNIPDRAFAAELYPCCVSVICGKMAEMDQLYMLRQEHATRYHLPLPSEWVKGEKWCEAFELFLKGLSKCLSITDGIPLEQAAGVVKNAFDAYLNKHLGYEKQQNVKKETSFARLIRGFKDRLKQKALISDRILPVWQLLRRLKYRAFPIKEDLTRQLLDPASKYHQDFMPAYEIITAPAGRMK